MAKGKKKGRSRSKSTKPRKKKAKKRVSKIARGKLAKSQVFKGRKAKTVGGLCKKDICRNKHGKYVSKKMSRKGKKSKWIKAVMAARKKCGTKGFCAVGGKSKAGKRLLKCARACYKKCKWAAKRWLTWYKLPERILIFNDLAEFVLIKVNIIFLIFLWFSIFLNFLNWKIVKLLKNNPNYT